MNLCMFFEGTGQGVAGKLTNVTRLRDLSGLRLHRLCRGFAGTDRNTTRLGTVEKKMEFKEGMAK